MTVHTVDLTLYGTSNTGASVAGLSNAFGARWQDPVNQYGTFEFKLPLGDSDIAQCTDGRVVRFGIGSDRWAGIIEKPPSGNVISVADEGGAESVTIKGRGLASDLEWAKVLPAPPSKSPGTIADIFPPIDDRPMEWYGVDFDDSTGWEDSVELGTHGESSAVSPGLPGGMRVLGAKWIWLDGAADDFLIFREWVFLDEGFYCLDFCAYDAACFINGRRHPRNAAYNAEAERVEFTVINGGYIMLAFEADLRDPVGYDPGLVWQITEGQEGALVYASGSAMQVYSTPDPVLTMSADEVLNALKDGHPSASDWTFDFGSGLDSDGNSLSGTHAIAPRIGADSIGSVLRALSEIYIDFDVEASGKTLQIWDKGSHANTPTTTWVPAGSTAGNAAPDTVNMIGLDWDLLPAEFDALIVRYQDGPFTRPAILPTKPKFEYLGIPHVPSGAIAIDFADRLLDAFGGERPVATFTQLRDMADGDRPYVGYDKWSAIPVPTRDDLDSTTSMPVKAITCVMDEFGTLDDVTVECGNFYEDVGTRLRRWIDVSSRGGMHGLVQAAQGVYAATTQRTPGLNHTEIVLFDTMNQDDGATASRTMPGKGFVHKLIARVEDPSGGTTDVDVSIGGVVTNLTGTTGSGFQLLDIDEGLGIPYGPRTEAGLTMTTVGHAKVTIYAAVSETR